MKEAVITVLVGVLFISGIVASIAPTHPSLGEPWSWLVNAAIMFTTLSFAAAVVTVLVVE